MTTEKVGGVSEFGRPVARTVSLEHELPGGMGGKRVRSEGRAGQSRCSIANGRVRDAGCRQPSTD